MKFLKHSMIVDEKNIAECNLNQNDIRRGMLLEIVRNLSDEQIQGIGHFEIQEMIEEYPQNPSLKKYTLTVQDNIIQQTCSLN